MSRKKHDAHYPAQHKTPSVIICVDYSNVFGIISQRSDNDQPDAVVIDLIKELKKFVKEEYGLQTARVLCFASLPPNHVKGHRATGAWLSLGIEPRFTYAKTSDDATAIDLALEAGDISNQMGQEASFVVLSGNQWFVPLIQRLKRRGHFVQLATLESPESSDDLPEDCRESHINIEFLLGGPGRKLSAESKSGQADDDELASRKPAHTTPITDEVVKRTLEIIDSYFGQYEEIYLTPLLRKLSEVFENSDDEPKALINDLEEVGAVWLQKRRGFPHNYTVLMLNDDHPDVAELKEARLSSEEEVYDEEEDEDDYYDDYADHDDDSDLDAEEDDDRYEP